MSKRFAASLVIAGLVLAGCSGDSADGDPTGQLNAYLGWDTTGIVDDEHSWEMRVWLSKDAPDDTALVDVTPRRLQRFRPRPGETLHWSSSRGRGELVVDHWGLATVRQLEVTKAGVRLRLTRQP